MTIPGVDDSVDLERTRNAFTVLGRKRGSLQSSSACWVAVCLQLTGITCRSAARPADGDLPDSGRRPPSRQRQHRGEWKRF